MLPQGGSNPLCSRILYISFFGPSSIEQEFRLINMVRLQLLLYLNNYAYCLLMWPHLYNTIAVICNTKMHKMTNILLYEEWYVPH